MAYSKQAIGLQRIAVVKLPRIADRLSFLSLDRCKIVQGRTGVIAILEDGSEVQVPGGSLVVLHLGPGVSITTPAMRTLANSGCTVIASTSSGDGCYTTAVPLTSSGKWAMAQAALWADDKKRMKAARFLFQQRFPEPIPDELTLAQLRSLEGRRMKAVYREASTTAGLPNWRRKVDDAENSANACLNLANSILYGVAAGVCSAFVLSPALGIIHQGAPNAFLFDLADCFKTTVSIPAAFESCRKRDAGAETRRRVRNRIRSQRVVANMTKITLAMLEGEADKVNGDVDLLLDDNGFVPGHTNYAGGQIEASYTPSDPTEPF